VAQSQKKRGVKGAEKVLFSDLTAGVGRRAAAVCFLELLQLKTWGSLELHQEQPFAEIEISAVA
jgi:chromatin segregation and condensation protein Rec8/ScpA/Scc1 (kleisin family)